jgi:predicted esterase
VRRALAAALLLAACHAPLQQAAGLRYLKLYTHGGDENSPLIVWLHGRGRSAEFFEEWWRGFPGTAEIVLLQAPYSEGFGYTWWPGLPKTEAEAARLNLAAEEKLWPAIEELAHGRKVIVVGHSQGAELTYSIAALHADRLTEAVPISGALPSPLWPSRDQALPPVHPFHCRGDRTVELKWDTMTARAFRTRVNEFPGDHRLSDEVRAAVFQDVEAATRFTR